MKKIFLFFLIFLFSNSVFSLEKVLCTITSDIDSNYAQIIVDMNENTHSINGMYQDSFENNQLIERIEILEEQLKDGVILDQEGDRVTVRLQSDNFDLKVGGPLIIDTLYNGVTGTRKEYKMEMSIDLNGPVLLKNGKKFNKMIFIANRVVVLGVIGIENVIFKNQSFCSAFKINSPTP